MVHILLPLRLGCGRLLGHATHGLTANENGDENGVRKCGYIECSQLGKMVVEVTYTSQSEIRSDS